MKKIAADRNYRSMQKAAFLADPLNLGIPDWFLDVSNALTLSNFKYTPAGLATTLWHHGDTIRRTLSNKGVPAAVEKFIELYIAM
tara:strand:+ start:3113 stop:3367 length:255 start_codon:yes stop_codon:yes gene_type:complete